ncbi:MAG: DUF5916 domain-containing protein [Bacteroidales bacterium]
MRTLTAFAFLCLLCAGAMAEDLSPRHYKAIRLSGLAPDIDGILDDPAWESGPWTTGFIQHEPYNGREASQETGFLVLFDDDNIYVAIRAWDTAPDSIVSRLTRRDHNDGDAVGIAFDSYYDQRTAFIFGVTAGGIKFDFMMTDNGQNEDHSWDPNWWVKTSIHDGGWVAEMRIPLSQLRFERNGGDLWGLQVFRQIHRKGEMSFWSHIPKDAPGVVHLFGTLKGLGGIEPRRIFDITPYTVSSASIYPRVPDHPFLTGSDQRFKLGMDAKVGISNNLTMDLTINPDFGQVEADPSEVNLSAYETFFQEKRPFFIEGRNISSFGLGIGEGGIGNDNLFYSRRIGRRPGGQIGLPSGAYADIPSFTNILGAAKLTGKTKNGLSVAFIESVTAEEKAEIDLLGQRSFETIEPMTNFFVGRVQKDFREGNTILGGMVTSVHRKVDERLSRQMHRAAYSGGLDFTQYFMEKSWMFNVNAGLSHVEGSEAALLRTQRSSARYFQRPDAGHVSLDSSRTSLTGSGGRMQLGKIGGGHWNFMAAMTWKSPGFEINDMGYMREADQVFQLLWVGYKVWEPKGFYRSFNINMSQYTMWNFAGDRQVSGWNLNGSIRYKNYWTNNLGVEFNHNINAANHLRGGPAIRLPARVNSWFGASTDNRRKLHFSMGGNLARSAENYSDLFRISLGMTYKPIDNLNFSLNPSYLSRSEELQYIRQTEFSGEPRYLFGRIHQQVVSFSFRLNFTLLPDLTLQYWGQPFVAVGNYSAFKYITDPQASRLVDRFEAFGPDQIALENLIYRVDENRDGTVDYGFGKPDFRVKELLSNLVIRWEYSPGSSLYLVWSQNKSGAEGNGGLNYFRDLDELFSEKGHHTLLIKATYRIGVQ